MIKEILALTVVLSLAGCAGLTPEHKEQKQVLEVYQKTDALVHRKTVKLGLATAASVAAIDNVAKATIELKSAKEEREKAKEQLTTEFSALK